jgi:hypothetical protein
MPAMELWLMDMMREEELARGELKVALCLMFAFISTSGEALYSDQTIMSKTGLGESSVKLAINGLRLRRRISIRKAGRGKRHIYPSRPVTVGTGELVSEEGGQAQPEEVDPLSGESQGECYMCSEITTLYDGTCLECLEWELFKRFDHEGETV